MGWSAVDTYANEDSSAPFQLMLEDVETAVSEALASNGVADHVKASVTSTRAPLLYAGHELVAVELAGLDYDERRRAWSANMLIVKDHDVVKAHPISGRYQEQRPLPVLVRRVQHGHILEEGDIEMRMFSVTSLRNTTITDSAEMVGKTPVRMISKGRPIRRSEVKIPDVMSDGTTVHMRYHSPFIEITTMGEALESGGIGDYVRVRNLDSQEVIRAQIISANEVQADHHAP
ncbi:MAG: flagellar basal body P-ring formation protein FlgA [Sphaerospermopsis sp. SIO1G2]|nr:flagellar basal body P-ring formation protein FlgA [Sphaerospermopsis sp. SIO1G2]